MCTATTCRKCKRPTYRGCGMHIEQVLGHVPPAERCQCKNQPATASAGAAKGSAGAPSKRSSWFRR